MKKNLEYVREIYNEDLDEDKLQVEMELLRTILAGVNITCFTIIYKKLKKIENV